MVGAMALLDLVTLPVRLTVAAAETTLALGELVAAEGPIRRRNGYADRLMLVIGEGGLAERLEQVLTDRRGPMHLVKTVTAVLDPNRPLGRALAPGGTVDRLLASDGPMYRVLAEDGAVDRLLEEGGVLDRLLEEDGLLDRLLSEDGFVEKLVAEGGTLDQLVELGTTLERIQPRIAELSALIPDLHESVATLNRAVEPLSELANRIPGGRRRSAVEV